MRKFLCLLPLVALLFQGCAGYTLGAPKPTLMAKIHKLAVPSFKNETLEPRLEVLLANTVIKQLQQDGTYEVVDEKDADAILECRLIDLERHPARSVRGNVLQTSEFNLYLRCAYKVVNRTTGAVILERNIQGQTSFFVSGSDTIAADVNQDQRQAIPLAAEDMAVKLVSEISEGF